MNGRRTNITTQEASWKTAQECAESVANEHRRSAGAASSDRVVSLTHALSRPRLIGLLIAWALVMLSGFGYLISYANTPGATSQSPDRWPVDATIRRNGQQPTLIMFIHPECPCTRASVEELSRIVARCRGCADVHVVVLLPHEFPSGWEKTDLYRQAADIPEVTMDIDESGVEACRFDAMTSGHAVLYDTEGNLIFRGGITATRGHAGDNAGKDAVIHWLETGHAARSDTPVFGCGLFSAGIECMKGQLTWRK